MLIKPDHIWLASGDYIGYYCAIVPYPGPAYLGKLKNGTGAIRPSTTALSRTTRALGRAIRSEARTYQAIAVELNKCFESENNLMREGMVELQDICTNAASMARSLFASCVILVC